MASPFGRLLIVDDEIAVLEVLAEYLVSQGHAVDTASDGAEALQAFAKRRPDVVLLDIRMPGMDGVEVLRRLRALASTVPVVMVTANEDVALARLTLKLGAFDYVSKPFDFEYLDRTVTAALLQAMALVDIGGHAAPVDAWRGLVLTVFRATRGMAPSARTATGERMETSALAAAGEIAIGSRTGARRALEQLALLVWLARELGDVGEAERQSLDEAVGIARAALSELA